MKSESLPLNNVCFLVSSTLGLLAFALSTALYGQTSNQPTSAALNNDKAVTQANRPFDVPEMTPPTVDEKEFSFIDVGAKIPNYTAGQRWGTQGDPLTLMQNPVPAEVSIKSYSLPKDFQLELWAKESNEYWPEKSQPAASFAGLKGKPIAMNWDERGRLWICETIDYPNELQPEGQGRDRIKICEDTNNDGQADKFTIFAEHLSIPSTLVCYRGGVIVQDGQSTIYLKDTNGDDVADFKQVLITGWAMGDTHGGVSNFQYGPDNWIWAMQGYNNSEPIINGKPQMRFRQGFFRFKVVDGPADETAPAFAIEASTKAAATESSKDFNKHTVRVEALEFMRATSNNTWGLGFSEEGYVFGSTANGCPSVHMPIPNRFYDQVSGWSPKTLERISPTNNFKTIDSEIRQVDHHGGYTAAAGHAIYTARNYPESWWNRIGMVCEPTGHLVGAFVLEKSGAGYKSNNSFNVVASIDDWGSPIMSEVGPDGNVWVLDWYSYIIQHNPTPNGFKTGKGAAYESDLRDKRFARIYRVLYKPKDGSKTPSRSLTLDKANNARLVAALSDKNFFWRRTAQRLLVERKVAEASTLNALLTLVQNSSMDEIGLNPGAMHAIWTLAGLADQDNLEATKTLVRACELGFQHPSSPVRVAAIENCSQPQFARALELKLHLDSDPRVRLAFLLRAATSIMPGAILAEMLSDDKLIGNDEILLDAWTAAASNSPVDTLANVVSPAAPALQRSATSRVAILAENVARKTPAADQIHKLLKIDPASPTAAALWDGLAKGWPKNHSVTLSAEAQKVVRERFLADSISIANRASLLSVADKWSIDGLESIVSNIQDKLFQVALDQNAEVDGRLSAWDQAIRLSPASDKIIKAAQSLLTPQLSPEVGSKAIDSLRAARVDGLSKALFELRGSLGPQMAADILTLMLSRSELTQQLLDAIEAGQIQFSDLQLDQRQAVMNHPEKSIATRANDLMKQRGATFNSDRQALLDDWMPVTQMKGDLNNGIAMYKKHCSQCHKHGDIGNAIGPNLTGMAVHPKEEILMNIMDPSRSVENNFRTYQILTVDGQTITGMLAGESSNALRLINTQGKEEQVLREDIETMKASVKSLMPEGFESSISRQEMADLLTFLNNRDRYTPITLSTAATLSSDKPMPGTRVQGEKFSLTSYGKIEFEGVPFEIQDPQGGRIANMIVLQSHRARGPQQPGRPPQSASLPSSVTIPCTGKISTLHLLGCVAVGAFPANPNASESLIVRCLFEDGSTKDYPLINGKHIANYQGKPDVPESKLALESDGRQLRYLSLAVDSSKAMKSIELLKGDDNTLPIIFALTVESAGAH